MPSYLSSPRIEWLFRSNTDSWQPIGRIVLGIWLVGNAGGFLVRNLPSFTFSGLEWTTWTVSIGGVSLAVFLVGEGIWNARPIGWYGGIALGALFIAIGVSQWNAVGIVGGLALLPYLVHRRSIFFESQRGN